MRHKLIVFTGPMKSAKTLSLIHAHHLRLTAKQGASAFRPKRDTRGEVDRISSRFGNVSIPAIAVATPQEILLHINRDVQYVSIDEVQFFSDEIVAVSAKLLKSVDVAVAGLDLDYRALPFGPMSELLAMADEVHKFSAVCDVCGASARFTQRLTNGSPSRLNEPLVMIDGEATYEARCHKCFRAPR